MFRNRHAFTLVELLLVLGLLGIAFGLAVPGFQHAMDVVSVRAARDAVLGAAARARALAVARGQAQLVVDERTSSIAILSNGTVQLAPIDLAQRYGVNLDITNSARATALVDYDVLGVGRLAGLTVKLQRRTASAGVTFSAYGRARAW